MDINASLIGQALTFLVLVLFTMKFVWPPLIKAIEDRREQIAGGLAAAEKGQHDLDLAEKNAADRIRAAKGQAAEVIALAEKRAAQIVDEAKQAARAEGDRQLAAAKAEIEQEVVRAKEELRQQVAILAVAGAEKILRREVTAANHADLLDSIKAEL